MRRAVMPTEDNPIYEDEDFCTLECRSPIGHDGRCECASECSDCGDRSTELDPATVITPPPVCAKCRVLRARDEAEDALARGTP